MNQVNLTREELNRHMTKFLCAGGSVSQLEPQEPIRPRKRRLKLTPTPGQVEYQQFVRELSVEVAQ